MLKRPRGVSPQFIEDDVRMDEFREIQAFRAYEPSALSVFHWALAMAHKYDGDELAALAIGEVINRAWRHKSKTKVNFLVRFLDA